MMEQIKEFVSNFDLWVVIVGTVVGGMVLLVILWSVRRVWNSLIPLIQAKVWMPLHDKWNKVWNLLCSIFLATYSFLGRPVIHRAIEEYKNELSDHIWMQEMPLKNDEDACLIPFHMNNNREAYKEILKVKFIAAGKGMAYRDILNHMFEPGTAPPQPVGYHGRRTDSNCYKWATDDASMKERLILVEDEAEKDALLCQKPPSDKS